jgi:hypothetical protein
MSAQYDNLVKAFRDLPYADMMNVADAVCAAGGGIITLEKTAQIAHALAHLKHEMPEGPDEDERNLRELIRRKRSVSISPVQNGWIVEIPGIAGSQAQSPSLRVALQHMLDQAITAKIMLGA